MELNLHIHFLKEQLTVKDLVSGVIERQLKRNDSHSSSTPLGTGSPSYPPGPSESPTITSILKDSQRNYAVGRNSAVTVVTSTAPTSPPRPGLTADAKQPLNLDSTSMVCIWC